MISAENDKKWRDCMNKVLKKIKKGRLSIVEMKVFKHQVLPHNE
jgi:hypothetical protein